MPGPDPGQLATRAVGGLGTPILTVVDADGWPVPIVVTSCQLEGETFRVGLPRGQWVPTIEGRACLTFSKHTPDFREYENALFLGSVTRDGERAVFRIERALPTISLTGSRWRRIREFASFQRIVKDRVRTEAARRGQGPPKIRIPRYR